MEGFRTYGHAERPGGGPGDRCRAGRAPEGRERAHPDGLSDNQRIMVRDHRA